MMLLNIAQTAILADGRLLSVEANELNWVSKCGVAVCREKIQTLRSKSMRLVRNCMSSRYTISDPPPSQATILPPTLIGGTSLINSIGDFLLVSCRQVKYCQSDCCRVALQLTHSSHIRKLHMEREPILQEALTSIWV